MHLPLPYTLSDTVALQKTEKEWEYVFSDHFRMNGVYWALTALSLLPGNPISRFMAEDDIVAWISNCKKPDGSYGHNVHHDGCLLATLSAVQILVLLKRHDEVDADAVASCVRPLLLCSWLTCLHDSRTAPLHTTHEAAAPEHICKHDSTPHNIWEAL